MVQTRPLTEADVPTVAHMRQSVLGWERYDSYVRRAIVSGHAVGAFSDGGLVGFRYQHAMTPDVLGDGLILVHPAWQGRGVGRQIVEHFERSAPAQFRLSVVVNTDLFDSRTPKAGAAGFWTACGYCLVASTGRSNLLVRTLVRCDDVA